jgi:Ca2+-transporting ATPase
MTTTGPPSVDASAGLSADAVAESRRRHGSNRLTPLPREPAWRKFLGKFDEPIIKILLAAALLKFVVDLSDSAHGGSMRLGLAALAFVLVLVATGLAVRPLRHWLPALLFGAGGVLAVAGTLATGAVLAEGLAVMVAVALATGVSFYSEYKSGREFEVLNARTTEHTVKVVRDGQAATVPLDDVVVGDVVLLDTGDEVPADGRLLAATELHIDQSLLTGESEPVEKSADAAEAAEVFRGTTAIQGIGRMVVTAVGDATQLGRLARSLSDDGAGDRIREKLNARLELTPLQQKLERLANLISRVGYVAAVAVFLAFLAADVARGRIAWPFDADGFRADVFRSGLGELLQAFVVMVVIIVVAVPEGLPMSVTVSLALAMRKMTRASSLVRRMVACETIGSATIICTDKTGTLTQNRMTVVRVNGGEPAAFQPRGAGVDWLAINAAVNSTAHLERTAGAVVPLGNSTEAALLLWLADQGLDYRALRSSAVVRRQEPFSSERKRMTTVVEVDGRPAVLVKGAPEYLMGHCDRCLDPGGRVLPWSDAARAAVAAAYADAAAHAMRTLAFGHADGDDADAALIFDGHVAIRDPLRAEVPDALARCRKAGIEVLMITGDNPVTARAIAADAGLLDVADPVVLTSDEFNALSDEQLIALLPRLRVLARAKPLDKLRLVNLLQARGHVVAMTGDGTNDAPSLKRADVGLSMGKSGTEVAKEASDIVLLDDSFATIVRAVEWGRALYENIQRFLQFQLTINVSALAIAFLGTLMTGTQPPFTVLQMLWINVIMDTFAAIALCSEPPRPGLMRGPPKRRDDDILTRPMKVTILTTAVFYIVVMLGLILGMRAYGWFAGDGTASAIEAFSFRQATIFFTTYVLFQVYNQINCRSLTPKVSGLVGLHRNPLFLVITALTLAGQMLIVTFGGRLFNVEPLSARDWLTIAAATSSVLVFAEAVRWLRRNFGSAD